MALRSSTRFHNLFSSWIATLFPRPEVRLADIQAALAEGRLRKILFIRQNQGIGDLLFATPLIRELRERYPRLEMHVLLSPYNAVAFRLNPRLARLWLFDKRELRFPWKAWRFYRALRAEHFDLAIPLFTHTPSWTSFFLARLSGARCLWSYDSFPFYGGANWSRTLSDIEQPAPQANWPEWRKYSGVLEPLLGVLPSPRTEFFITPEQEAWGEQTALALRARQKAPLVGLFLGGNPARPERYIPLAVYVQLTAQIEAMGGSVLAICPPSGLVSGSGQPEANMYDAFCKILGRPIPRESHPTLGNIIGLLKRLDLFIAPDGGLFHMSCAAGVHTLGVFAFTDPVLWCPPGRHVRAIGFTQDEPPEAIVHRVQPVMESMLKELNHA